MNELDELDQIAAAGVRRVHRPQGPGPQVQGPVPGADLRRRVPARPLLREHRRGGDRRGPGDRRAPAARPDRARRRGGALQVAGPRAGLGQADRPDHRAAGRRHRLLPGDAAQPAAQGRPHRRPAGPRQRADAHRRLLRRDRARVRRRHRRGAQRPAVLGREPSPDPALASATSSSVVARGRQAFTLPQWRAFLLRSVGFEPDRAEPREHRTCCCCAWSRSSSATTTWWSSGRAAPASPTSSSRSRPTRTSSRAARRPWPRCSSTTRPASAASCAQYDVVCFDEVCGDRLRPEGRRQHHEGLHGVRRVQPRARRASGPTAASSWSATSRSTWSTSSGSATCSARSPRRCATTPRSWTASTPTSRAGTSRSCTRPCSPTTSAWSATSWPRRGHTCATQTRLPALHEPGLVRTDAQRARHLRPSTRRSAAC